MHKARAFFYVCAGLFLLALSYHLGARSAGAQAGGSTVASGTANGYNAVIGRTVYTMSFGQNPPLVRPPVPGSDAIIAVDGNASGNTVLLANGDAYRYNPIGTPSGWIYDGNLFGIPTPLTQGTWGAVKSHYRGERGAAQPAPQGR